MQFMIRKFEDERYEKHNGIRFRTALWFCFRSFLCVSVLVTLMVNDVRVKIKNGGQVFWCTNKKTIDFWTKLAQRQLSSDKPMVRVLKTLD